MEKDSEKLLREIILAGWLYDLPDFAQRAGLNRNNAFDKIKAVFPPEIDTDEVLRLLYAQNGTNSYDEMILQEAEKIAAGTKERKSAGGNDSQPLVSLISELTIDNREKTATSYVPMLPLEKDAIVSRGTEKLKQADYAKQWKFLEDDFLRFKKLNCSDFFKALDTLLLRYCWCIPYATEKELADVSMYQHAKMTASFAGIIYRYQDEVSQQTAEAVCNKTDKKFLFVNGDISGIQKYIFDLKSSADNAKLLRAKSFELLALSQILAEHITVESGGTDADIITSSGGKFLVVLPNTTSVKERLCQIRAEYESYFLQEFAGKLCMIVSSGTEASEQDICGSDKNGRPCVKNLINRISYDSDCAKQHKMQIALSQNGSVLDTLYDALQKNGECACCTTMPAQSPSEGSLCRNCQTLKDIGGKLVKKSCLIYHTDKISHFGSMVEISDNIQDSESQLINQYIPGYATLFLPYVAPVKDDYTMQLLTFEEIANKADGNKKLAMFKSDIDNLGLVFSSSLGNKMTFARYAEMSRLFQYFFSGYYAWYVQNNEEYDKKIYTVYSGGDDLCVIGAWDTVMHFAADFNKELKKFTHDNKSVTLSGGIVIASPSEPLRFMADDAEEQLDRSKARTADKRTVKNALTVFSTTVSWSDYDICLDDGEKFKHCLDESPKKLSTAAVYKLLDFADRAKRVKKEGSLRDMVWQSNFAYMAARTVNKKNGNEELKSWYTGFGIPEKIEQARISASYALYSQRNDKEEQ